MNKDSSEVIRESQSYITIKKEGCLSIKEGVCDELSSNGFYQMDWGWHCDYTKAKAQTMEMNEELGLTAKDVIDIVTSTMEPPTYH